MASLEERIALMESVGRFAEVWENEERDEVSEMILGSHTIAFLMSFREVVA